MLTLTLTFDLLTSTLRIAIPVTRETVKRPERPLKSF